MDYSNNNTTTFNFNLKYAAKIVIEINSNIQKIKNSIKNKDIDSISNSLIIKTIGLIEDTGIILQTYKSFIDNYPIFGSKHTNHGTDINNYDLLNQNEFLLNTIIENSIFVIPEAEISEHVMTIPGIDGQKMSKSLNNYIDIFSDEKDLLKQIKKIVTDATPLEDPKNPDEDITFKLYQLIASPEEVAQMRANYLQGGYGYGHAKQALYEAMLAYFKDAREKFDYYMANPKEIEAKLEEGEARVKPIAEATIQRVREIFQF
ncbi:hypothetical protein EWU23_02015 [Cytophagaceae bacterium 50C-KIRBA]|uniref:Tryptophan--tRNA ligase n=1 Tax=Aquirufa beregesia TaxID=2516556 RepID=A0ABX0ETB7_9BACT|nr:hypothetical protein [Aquirufa beregesia]